MTISSLRAAIFISDFWLHLAVVIVVVIPDPKSIKVAAGISLLSCLRAEICALPV
jgi:hypothetical protein